MNLVLDCASCSTSPSPTFDRLVYWPGKGPYRGMTFWTIMVLAFVLCDLDEYIQNIYSHEISKT